METTTGEGVEGGMRRRISSKLDFFPEEEDHERDQNQKLSRHRRIIPNRTLLVGAYFGDGESSESQDLR